MSKANDPRSAATPPGGGSPKKGAPPRPAIGSVVAGNADGRTIRARVVEGGFEYRGTVYPSLAAVAAALACGNWNAYVLMRLTARAAPRPRGR